MPVFTLLPSLSKNGGAGEEGILSARCVAYFDFSYVDTHPSSVFGRTPCLFAWPRAYLALFLPLLFLACLLCATSPTFAFWMITLLVSLFKIVLG